MVPPRRDASEASLTSVAEMIDSAFGNDEDNTVDFRSINAILLIIARSLCILDRQVAVKLPYYTQTVPQGENITINEVKVSARVNTINDQNEFEAPDHKSTKLKFSSHEADQNNNEITSTDKNTKKNIFSTQIFYVVSEKASSNKQHQISNKNIAGPRRYEFPEKYLISSEEESVECIRKKYKKNISSELTSSKKSQDTMGKRGNLNNSSETHQEKILIVERRPSTETVLFKSSNNVKQSFEQTPKTLVTKEKYYRLKNDVIKLQQQYGTTDHILHERTSLSNPKAMLQISARLEVVETAIEKMTDLLTYAMTLRPASLIGQKWRAKMAKQIAEEGIKKNLSLLMNIKVLSKTQVPVFSPILIKNESRDYMAFKTDHTTKISFNTHNLSKTTMERESTDSSLTSNYVTIEEFRFRTSKFAADMAKTTQKLVYSTTLRAEATLQNTTLLGGKMTRILQNVTAPSLEALESKIKDFANGVNKIDISLSNTTTQFHEELVSLEAEISTKLENLADAMSKQEPENDDIPELINKFNLLLKDIIVTNECQDELDFKQSKLFERIKILKKTLNELQLIKANRDDVEKAIESKVYRSTVNGIVTMPQFCAILGNWEKHLHKLFNNLHNQEVYWQAHINRLWTNFDESADQAHFDRLKEDINKNIFKLNEKLGVMIHLCNSTKNENDTWALRVLDQESCICCDIVHRKKYSKHLNTRSEQQMNGEISNVATHKTIHDKNICYHNLPITHPLDTRVETCGKCVRLKKTVNSNFDATHSLTSNMIGRSSSRDIFIKNKGIVKPCKECNISKHEIVTTAPIKSSKSKAKSYNQTKQSDRFSRTTRDSFASERSKHSRVSNKSSKRSVFHEHLRDSFTEEAEEEPILIILDDD